jgi:hypothetical protein
MARKHYHAMAGMSGCMPNYNSVHTSREAAVRDLIDTHDGGPRGSYTELKETGLVYMDVHTYGNEYMEISAPCTDDCFDED